MARVFITGSSDGLGSLVAQALIKKKHQVVLHARNAARAEDALAACPGAEKVLVADLSSLDEVKQLANDANNAGPFDVVIHNAAVFKGDYKKTQDGLATTFAVNSLAPYVLTCLIKKPKRLVFLSSGMHFSGDASTSDLAWIKRGEKQWSYSRAYSDSKLHNVLLASVFARLWPGVASNSMDPGWVPTKMGGSGATGDIQAAVDTYVMLAEGNGGAAGVTGKYLANRKVTDPKAITDDIEAQDRLLKAFEEISGVSIPSDI